MLREIYLEDGWWSIAAWIGTAIIAATVAAIPFAVLGMRVPRTRPARAPRRRLPHPMSLLAELLVRLGFALAARVLRLDQSGVRRAE